MTTTTTRAQAGQLALADPSGAEAFVREWIDPAYLRLVQLLSAPAAPGQISEGLLILAHLCRRAIQPDLFPAQDVPHVARLTFRGIVGLCGSSDAKLYGPWPASRETTLKWLIMLEAITLIFRYRSQGETIVLIPLGRRSPLDLGSLLKQIEASEQRYTNKKTRALLKRSKERLTLCRAALSEAGDAVLQPDDRPTPAELHQQLLAHLQGAGLTPGRCAHIASWFTLASAGTHGEEAGASERTISSHPAASLAGGGRIKCGPGDSTGTGGGTMATSVKVAGDSLQRESPSQHGIATKKGVSAGGAHQAQGSSDAARRVSDQGDSKQSGDSAAQSNLESFSSFVITLRGSRFDSEEALLAEAERYVRLLDGPLAPKSKWTKGVVMGYRNCIEQNPLLASISLINTLLKLHCPLQGEDHLRIPRKWFHTSFKKYADAQDPMPLTDDIRSFVESAFSYEEIAQALSAWFDRHHACVVRRPCVGDLIAGGLLPEIAYDAPEGEIPPPYPSPESPWGPESCLALFDHYRGRLLPSEQNARAARAALTLVGAEEDQPHSCGFDRFEVESVLIAWLEGDVEVRALLRGEEGGDAFPEAWAVAEVMEQAWPLVRAQMLATGLYVEMDDGELLAYDEYLALYERSVSARREEEELDAYEHSLTYYLRLLQEEESAYKTEQPHQPAETPAVPGVEAEDREEDAEWTDPQAALRWARPLRETLPFDLYGLEICMTKQWHCVLVVWSRESPEDDTLTLYNSAQVMQLIEGFQEAARQREGQGTERATGSLTARSEALSDHQEPFPVEDGTALSGVAHQPQRETPWGPDG